MSGSTNHNGGNINGIGNTEKMAMMAIIGVGNMSIASTSTTKPVFEASFDASEAAVVQPDGNVLLD